jgi:uncharacterized damage-inducible protein DinB
MDLLDRLLKHDAWTTRRLMELCLPLSDEQLDRDFAIGPGGTLRTLWHHVVGNAVGWTALMRGEEPEQPRLQPDAPIVTMIAHYDRASADLYDLARRIQDAGRLDDTFLDHLDDPPTHKPFGGAILHLATHGMHHRAQALYMMRKLGLPDVSEGDALGWEHQHTGGWQRADAR